MNPADSFFGDIILVIIGIPIVIFAIGLLPYIIRYLIYVIISLYVGPMIIKGLNYVPSEGTAFTGPLSVLNPYMPMIVSSGFILILLHGIIETTLESWSRKPDYDSDSSSYSDNYSSSNIRRDNGNSDDQYFDPTALFSTRKSWYTQKPWKPRRR